MRNSVPNFMPKMIKPDPEQERTWELFLGEDRNNDPHRSLGGSTLLALLGVPELEESDEIFADYIV
jgi:hypothetical protein